MKKIFMGAMLLSFSSLFAQESTIVDLAWDYPSGEWNYVGGQHGTTTFADLDNDGFLDMFSSQNNNTIILQQTDGNEWWLKVMKAGEGLDQTSEILNYRNGTWGFIDYNNDGYLDFIYTGVPNSAQDQSQVALFVYKNNGDKSFTKDDINTAAMAEAAVYNYTNENMSRYHFAIADYNNDGWSDVVINGSSASQSRYLALFINNNGVFEKSDALSREVDGNTVWSADFDNDGNMDFVVSGYSVDTHATWIYYGNGDGTFVEQPLTYGFEKGTVIAMDVDNDGLQDILVGGDGYIKSMDTWVSGIAYYRNNGDRTYTETFNPSGLDGWYRYGGQMQPADFNNDGLMDFAYHTSWGDNNTDPKNAISKVVLNNGDGTFTPVLPGKFYTVCQGGLTAFDYKQDGVMDLYSYGWDSPKNSGDTWASHLIENKTNLTAYQAPEAPATAVYVQKGENVVIRWTSATDAITPQAALRYNVYAKNKATGEVFTVAPANVETGALKFIHHGAFITSDSYTFVGMNADEYEFGVQTINTGYKSSAFTVCTPVELAWKYPICQLMWEWTNMGSSQFADYNNDGKLELLLSGGDWTRLYAADGWFSQNKTALGAEQLDIKAGASSWLDYNNDGYLDFIIVGCSDRSDSNTAKNSSQIALYKNINGTTFEIDAVNTAAIADAVKLYNSVESVQPGHFAIADYDNDGWVDIVISGETVWVGNELKDHDHWRLTKLFWNNQGSFAVDNSGAIEQVNNNGAWAADFNNDGLMDFVVGGYSDVAGKQVTTIYYSNGDRTFAAQDLGHGCQDGSLAVTDINNDGWQDILVSGYGTDNGIYLMLNNGDGSFTYKSNAEIGLPDSGLGWASLRSYMVVGDYNNDGYNDVVSQCQYDGSKATTHLLINNGDCTFTKNDNHKNVSVRNGGISLLDYNQDGKLDIHVYGYGDSPADNPYGEVNDWFNNIMVNNTLVDAYTAPVMGEVACEQKDDNVVLSWAPATDAITPQEALRYNVYAKNKTTGEVMMVAPANIETGVLKFINHGAFLTSNKYTIKDVNTADYEFGVQAINNGYVASKFVAPSLYTSVDAVKAHKAVKVYTVAGELRLTNSDAAVDYSVYAVNGVRVASGKLAAGASAQLRLAKGVYVVKAGDEITKVIL